YPVKYHIGREDLFSIFNVCGTGSTIVGVIASTPLAKRFGKRDVFIAGLALTVVCTAAFVLLPRTAVALIFGIEMLRQLAYGFTIPLLWAMMADVADFSEWKNHRRGKAVFFLAPCVAVRGGLGFGGAITGYLLAVHGY